MRRDQTETITLRLEKKILTKLRRESEQNQTSLNTLANQIFRQHIDWHSKASKAGYVPLLKPVIIKLLDRLSEEDVIRVAEEVSKDMFKDVMLLMRDENDLVSTLNHIETWIRMSGFPYKLEVDDDKEVYSYVIQHDMGKKFSLLLAARARVILERLEKQGNFVVTDNTIVLKVDLGKTG
ncbi:MAG TPA: hypothetical protein VKA09_02510 [Nitrososphaeraceae archaeon]|nr:hypothetical protein [Nitrososphaeraceae archaeon]